MKNLAEAATQRAPRLFGTNGIRGTVGPEVNVNLAYRVGGSVAILFKGRKILLGRDGRTSSIMLAEAVASGVMGQGNEVEDHNTITTPALEYHVKTSTGGAGIMVTASHNPPEYNGFKIIDTDGVEIPREKEEAVEDLVHRNQWTLAEKAGSRTTKDRLDFYLDRIMGHLEGLNQSNLSRLTVVIDIGNGVSALTTPVLLQRLGCRVVTMNGNIDGAFPGRSSEPRPENLGALSKAVLLENADLGIAHDGDGDRAIFVDETGLVQWGDRTFALIENMILKANPGAKVVTPLNSSMAIREIAETQHGQLIQTKVGSIYVSRTMLRENALLGGEENGGIFYMPHHPVRDGTMAAALVLKAMATEDEPLSKMISRLPTYHMGKEKVLFKSGVDRDRAMLQLTERLRSVTASTMDGVKIDVDGRGWVLIRASGTEPLIRIYVEGRTDVDVSQLLSEYKPIVVESANA